MKLFEPTYVRKSVSEIEDGFFKREGISCVLLDIDNTLVADNDPYPDDAARAFIKRVNDEKLKVCLVSNNKLSRVESFNGEFLLKAVHRAHKPFCCRMNKAIKELGATKEETLFIGDQLLTDMLAGNLCKIRTMLVDPINPGKENLFFKFKRFIENYLLKRNFR